MGHVLNEKLVRRHLHRLGQREDDCSDKEIYERGIFIISKTDIIVAIYIDSFGEGGEGYDEVGYHISNKGKVICLVSQKQKETASVMYKEKSDIVQILVCDSPQDAELLLKRAVIGMGL